LDLLGAGRARIRGIAGEPDWLAGDPVARARARRPGAVPHPRTARVQFIAGPHRAHGPGAFQGFNAPARSRSQDFLAQRTAFDLTTQAVAPRA